MRSSSAEYFIALDHVRALAAFMVFNWHFTHGYNGQPVSFGYAPPFFLLSILDEGHTGVALFMTLSGYLFCKLLDGKQICYKKFLIKRALRLLPLLFMVIIINGIQNLMDGEDIRQYLMSVAKGLVYPSLPNGGWSVTVECHFYVLLPYLLWVTRHGYWPIFIAIFICILARWFIHFWIGEVERISYFTILGRFDQFALGMAAYRFRRLFSGRHLQAALTATLFCAFYEYFDYQGGLFKLNSYPSPSRLWILIPTIEGFSYAALIAYYDNSFSLPSNGFSKLVALIGKVSYSAYLLHFYYVFGASRFIQNNVADMSSLPIACAYSLFCFLIMTPVCYLSYRFIEQPFIALGGNTYIKPPSPQRRLNG